MKHYILHGPVLCYVILIFGFFVFFAASTPTSGRLYVPCLWSHDGSFRLQHHRGFLLFFFLPSFSPLLKLWLFTELKLQKALINGSRDAPAISHSAPHNRQTRGAEPGMEYWRNEWKHTQTRDPTSPMSVLSPCSLKCIIDEKGSATGLPFSINYWRSMKEREVADW